MQRVWKTITGFYHVCARGMGGQLIFESDEDRWEFLELMRDCCRDAQVTIVAWCLMSDYVDLVLLDYEDKMSAAMQRLLLTYARRFNKRTGRAGCLFRERFERRIKRHAFDFFAWNGPTTQLQLHKLVARIPIVARNGERIGITASTPHRHNR